jgi:predicted amidohydrolase
MPNPSQTDSLRFQPGSKPCSQTIAGSSFGVVIGREIMFPELWSEYQATGAKIVFHINNAINPKDQIWEH